MKRAVNGPLNKTLQWWHGGCYHTFNNIIWSWVRVPLPKRHCVSLQTILMQIKVWKLLYYFIYKNDEDDRLRFWTPCRRTPLRRHCRGRRCCCRCRCRRSRCFCFFFERILLSYYIPLLSISGLELREIEINNRGNLLHHHNNNSNHPQPTTTWELLKQRVRDVCVSVWERKKYINSVNDCEAHTFSVTRWIDIFSIFGRLQQRKFIK